MNPFFEIRCWYEGSSFGISSAIAVTTPKTNAPRPRIPSTSIRVKRRSLRILRRGLPSFSLRFHSRTTEKSSSRARDRYAVAEMNGVCVGMSTPPFRSTVTATTDPGCTRRESGTTVLPPPPNSPAGDGFEPRITQAS